MQARCCATISRHLSCESLDESAFEPCTRKQSSRAFFVSGQAQQLFGARGVSVLNLEGRGECRE